MCLRLFPAGKFAFTAVCSDPVRGCGEQAAVCLQGPSRSVIPTTLKPVVLFFYKGLLINFVILQPNHSGRSVRKIC